MEGDMADHANTGGMEGVSDGPPTRKAVRRHLNVIEQAVYGGWELPDHASKTIPQTLQGILDDPNASVRDRIRASECMMALRRDRLDAAVQLDRIQRLDAGTATDRVEVVEGITDATLNAVAQSLVAPAKPAPKPCRSPKRKRKP
jgi:hypothetical protein